MYLSRTSWFSLMIIACAAGVIDETNEDSECEIEIPPTVDDKSKVMINPMLDDPKIHQVNQILLRPTHDCTRSYSYNPT